MKFFNYYIVTIFCIISFSCEQILSPYAESSIKTTFKIINPKDSINIGDSVIINFEIPDSILLDGVKTYLYSKENCTVSCAYNKMDSTTSFGYIDWTKDCIIQTSPGKLGNNSEVEFAKIGNKLYTKYAFIAIAKGVFFLECRFTGALTANNGSIKTKLVYDFDIPDKHLDLMRKAAGSKAALLEPWIQNYNSLGKGLYVFAVK